MRFERLTDADGEMFLKAMDLYWACFGLPMQREYYSQQCVMEEPDYRFELIYEDDDLAGLLLYWERESFLYVEHLCIAHAFRGRGLGSAALETLKTKGKTLILEADPLKGQTEYFVRCGFDMNGFDHVRPSYHAMFPGRNLKVMSWPYELEEDEYKEFCEYLLETVMAV